MSLIFKIFAECESLNPKMIDEFNKNLVYPIRLYPSPSFLFPRSVTRHLAFGEEIEKEILPSEEALILDKKAASEVKSDLRKIQKWINNQVEVEYGWVEEQPRTRKTVSLDDLELLLTSEGMSIGCRYLLTF